MNRDGFGRSRFIHLHSENRISHLFKLKWRMLDQRCRVNCFMRSTLICIMGYFEQTPDIWRMSLNTTFEHSGLNDERNIPHSLGK